jgi:malonate-semialdehyde dehydrogenase (acetylating)/methylmalonate-semialdehyde dehydrogenase
MTVRTIENYIGGEWVASEAGRTLDVINPATGAALAQVPLSTAAEVDQAVRAARQAFQEWRETPPYTRARAMFRLKAVMEDHFEELARIVTQENGKILDEARGEVRRAIENVEGAAGIPTLMMGYNLEDVAQGIDEVAIRQPLGVFCCIAPFNFPAMVPFWFLPYAVACGNTYVVKPSEQAPLTQTRLFELMEDVDFPPGVINLVHGDKDTAQALLEHPEVVGVSFVGSTPVARHVYQTAAAHGKRAQCQGGAKNFLVVMPDAPLKQTVGAIITSAFGNAGQRCLAGSVVLAVGDCYEPLKAALVEAAGRLRVGDGLDPQTQMGPVISARARERILNYIDQGVKAGARLLLDGRSVTVHGNPNGFFVGPTIFDAVTPEMTIVQEEIFGPVLGIMPVDDFDAALAIMERSRFGNAASIFTASGKWAREFQYRARCGNIGINVGVAAPIASFPFGGMKDSFFGDLHGQGFDGINFFTDRKVVITRWF